MRILITIAVLHVVLLVTQTLAGLRYCNENEDVISNEIELKRKLYYTREAELMALEATNSLLPDPSLVRKIRYDMKTIRSNFPAVTNITHRKKWSIGKLRFQNVASDDILRINESEFGPIKIRQLNLRYRAVETVMNITYITFAKPYNPVVLAQKLEEAFHISGDPIRSIFQDGDDTLYMHSENRNRSPLPPPPVTTIIGISNSTSENTNSPTIYTFIKGKGKCFISCENKRYWHFMVQCANQRNLDVTLMQEYNVNLKSASSSHLSSLVRAIRK